MPMSQNGLTKLVEELGELQQVIGKMLAYPELQDPPPPFAVPLHPDGTNLRDRMIEELGDVQAAMSFVTDKLELDYDKVLKRRGQKFALFSRWDRELEKGEGLDHVMGVERSVGESSEYTLVCSCGKREVVQAESMKELNTAIRRFGKHDGAPK